MLYKALTCCSSREDSLPNSKCPKWRPIILFPYSPISFAGQCYRNQNCRKTSDAKTSKNRSKNNFNVPQQFSPSVVENDKRRSERISKVPYPMTHYAFGRSHNHATLVMWGHAMKSSSETQGHSQSGREIARPKFFLMTFLRLSLAVRLITSLLLFKSFWNCFRMEKPFS